VWNGKEEGYMSNKEKMGKIGLMDFIMKTTKICIYLNSSARTILLIGKIFENK
jgi:hypothetical protein